MWNVAAASREKPAEITDLDDRGEIWGSIHTPPECAATGWATGCKQRVITHMSRFKHDVNICYKVTKKETFPLTARKQNHRRFFHSGFLSFTFATISDETFFVSTYTDPQKPNIHWMIKLLITKLYIYLRASKISCNSLVLATEGQRKTEALTAAESSWRVGRAGKQSARSEEGKHYTVTQHSNWKGSGLVLQRQGCQCNHHNSGHYPSSGLLF
jgi:hypothetical protein